jgi:hypothetical protein
MTCKNYRLWQHQIPAPRLLVGSKRRLLPHLFLPFLILSQWSPNYSVLVILNNTFSQKGKGFKRWSPTPNEPNLKVQLMFFSWFICMLVWSLTHFQASTYTFGSPLIHCWRKSEKKRSQNQYYNMNMNSMLDFVLRFDTLNTLPHMLPA